MVLFPTEERSCIVCGKRFLVNARRTNRKLRNQVRKRGSITCSRKCSAIHSLCTRKAQKHKL